MATLTSINQERMNPRERNILEEARLRKIAIQNLQRDNLEASAIWRDKQTKSYGNLVTVTEATPLSKIITDEQQARSQDEFLQRQHAIANISTLADQANTDYIIDRLHPTEMRWMNDNWANIIRDIKKKSTRMDKDVFVNFVVKETANGTSYDDSFVGNSTEAMDRTANLKALEADAVAQRLGDQRQAEDDRMTREEQEGLDLNTRREHQRLDAIRLAKIANLTARNQASRVQGKFKSLFAKRLPSVSAVPTLGSSTPPNISTPPMAISPTISASAQVGLSTLPTSTPPRAVSPTISASAQAGISASQLQAQLQAIADAKIANSAGGNATTVGLLTPVTQTVGNQVLAGGRSGSPVPSTTLNLATQPPPPLALARTKSHTVVTDTDIEKAIKIQPLTTKEETDFQTDISDLNDALSRMSTVEVKTKLNKVLGKIAFNETCDQLKKLTGLSNLNEGIYKKLYFLTAMERLREATSPSSSGKGLRKRRVIRGRGYTKNEHPKIKPRRHYVNDNFYVDLNKLDDNILCVKYAQNDSVLPHLKPQTITGKTKEMIGDILNNKYDDRIFKLLNSDEKRDVKKFCKCVKLDMNMSDDEEKEFQRQFDIVRGEYMSGNDSPQIKVTLKRYVLEALRDSKIAKADAYNLLYSLSL